LSAPGARAIEAHEPEARALRAVLRDGFALESCDSEYVLRFHVLGQIDFRIFDPPDQDPAAQTGMYIPRSRVYLEGQLTEPYEYELSLQRSLEGQFDLLDANFNIRFREERLQVKVGRFLVPYSYAWYDHLEQYFLVPERGLFPLNFGLSRATGGMVWGTLGEEELQYAIAGINGRLEGLADDNTTADAVGYINWRPFRQSPRLELLRYLNVGGSLALGRKYKRSEELPLRTAVQSSENDESAAAASAQFLEWNEGVSGLGGRLQGAIHLAWYYGPWTFEGEWQSGSFETTRPEGPGTVDLRVDGFHAGVGLMLTGETVTGRTVVEPLRPFDPRCGCRCGCGAIELFARYSDIALSDNVFTEDLADPDLWSKSAYITDIGFNWYWNRFLKWTFDWQHAGFGSPVLIDEEEDRFSSRTDLFWFRGQLYF
jgi:phosphate-selective porin OprO/OprP